MTRLSLLPTALSDLFAQASTTGKITLADRYGLMAAILDDTFVSEEDRYSIDRLLHAIRQGRLQVVDELCTIDAKIRLK